ncbi:MAG: transposase [Micromonosporaceae bacterium]
MLFSARSRPGWWRRWRGFPTRGPARGPLPASTGAGHGCLRDAGRGPVVRGARAAGGTAPHPLACLDQGTGVVLAQVAVDGKTNEITMFPGLLGQAGDLTGVLVTADALHARREHAAWLADRGAHYLVTVKGNQPRPLAQLRSLPWKQVLPGYVQDGRGHGRIETPSWPFSRADRDRARGGADGLRWRVRPHGAGRPAFNSRAGRCCRSTPGGGAAW